MAYFCPSSVCRVIAPLVMLLALAGCQSNYDLHVSLDPAVAGSLGDERVFVHLVPVNPRDHSQLEAMSVDDYWQYGSHPQTNPVRETGTKIFELSAAARDATLLATDPIWPRWRAGGADEFMVISSRPVPPGDLDAKEPASELAGERDPRRRFIALGRDKWGSSEVRVLVTSNGLRVMTPSKGP